MEMFTPSDVRKSSSGDRRPSLNLRPILDVVKRINSERNLRRLITMILDTMIQFSNATRGSLAIFKGHEFNAELSRHRLTGEIKHSEIPTLAAIIGRVSSRGKSVVVEDARKEPGLGTAPQAHGRAPLSIFCLPLRVKSRMIGAIYLDNIEEAGAFDARRREFAEILTDHAAIAMENALLYRKSTRDRVTDVYNHAAFENFLDEEVDRARRQGYSCGLLVIDVDNFKQINDTHGHEAGNTVLRDVAYTLSTTVRGADIVGRVQGKAQTPVVGRYGGDEFEIILPGATREGALATAKRLVTLFSGQRFTYDGRRLKISISIGVAVFPFDTKDTHELLLLADEALYQAKRGGKGRAIPCRARS